MTTPYLKVAAGSFLALAWMGNPAWSRGQTNLPGTAIQCEGAPIRVSALHPDELPELKGRPICVYNFTSW